MSSTPTALATQQRCHLLTLPQEMILQIFLDLTTAPQDPESAIALASCSRKLYDISHERNLLRLALLKRAVMRWLTAAHNRQEDDPALAECVVKAGIIRCSKPWPVSLEDIRATFTTVTDITQRPVISKLSICEDILAWVRSTPIDKEPRREVFQDRRAEERELFLQRSTFLRTFVSNEYRADYWESTSSRFFMLRHPFYSIDPIEILHAVGKDGQHRFVFYHGRKALQAYAEHANDKVSRRQAELHGTSDWVDCCLCEECPRFKQYFDAQTVGKEEGDAEGHAC